METAYQVAPAAPEPGFRDRSGWLIAFGIIELLMAAVCLLALPLMAFSLAMSSAMAPEQRTGTAAVAGALAFYAGAAAFFITMGVGTMRGRRWARAIMLIASWIWLIGGVFGCVVAFFMFPKMFAAAPAGAQPMPEGVKAIVQAIMVGFMVFVGVLIPAAFVRFYSGSNVRATFEAKHPEPAWTDRCPLPVLAVTFMLAYSAVTSSVALAYGVVPFFGQFVTGVPAIALILGVVLFCGWLAHEVYLLRAAGWWGTAALLAVGAISNIVTFSTRTMEEMYAKMGYPEAQLEMMRRMDLYSVVNIPLWTGVSVLLGAGYLLWIRKYFVTAAPEDHGQ